MKYKLLSYPEKWILKGIPILFAIGSVLHFAYEFLGENLIIGIFSPINESVWEHLKMVLLPIILWWSLYYLFKGKVHNIDKNKWFAGALISLLTSLFTIPMLYYFYTQAFGKELLIVDILILLLSLITGQLIGLHFYKHSKGINANIVLLIFVFLIFAFAVFTFFPPPIPLFSVA